MYLDQVNYELNKKINDFVCNSNDVPTPEERIDILKQAWELLPKPATQFVEPTSVSGYLLRLRLEKQCLMAVYFYGQVLSITN